MLRGNKVLTSLNLGNCDIGPEGLSELCSALEVNTTLTELNLTCNKFDDHRLASLGRLLHNHSSYDSECKARLFIFVQCFICQTNTVISMVTRITTWL